MKEVALYVYVAGPLSQGDIANNVLTAISMGESLWDHGFIPYVPHLTHYWNKLYPHTWDEWLKLDEQWLRLCDALLRIPGESKGADREEQYARALDIPVFYDLEELKTWGKTRLI